MSPLEARVACNLSVIPRNYQTRMFRAVDVGSCMFADVVDFVFIFKKILN
jgi:hypothetical protein